MSDLEREHRYAAEIAQEHEMSENAQVLARALLEICNVLRWGDGTATGCASNFIHSAAEAMGVANREESPAQVYRKVRIPPELRWAVWERDNFTCQQCGHRRDLACDHIIPEKLGGPTELSNLQTLCRPCNTRKGARVT